MFFECFIDEDAKKDGISFLVEGRNYEKAREKAETFLNYFEMPTEDLFMRRLRKPKKPNKRVKALSCRR